MDERRQQQKQALTTTTTAASPRPPPLCEALLGPSPPTVLVLQPRCPLRMQFYAKLHLGVGAYCTAYAAPTPSLQPLSPSFTASSLSRPHSHVLSRSHYNSLFLISFPPLSGRPPPTHVEAVQLPFAPCPAPPRSPSHQELSHVISNVWMHLGGRRGGERHRVRGQRARERDSGIGESEG